MNLQIAVRGVVVTARKDIRIYYRKAPVYIFGLVLPLFLFFAFFVGRELDIQRYFPGFLAMTIFFTSSSVGPLIIPWEKQAGNFERLLTLPVSVPMLVMGDTLAGTLFGTLISAIILGVGALLLPLTVSISSIFSLAALFFLGNLCFAAMGVLISSPSGRVPSNVMMLSTLVRFPLIFISGIFTPLTELSGAARTLSLASPLTYLSDGLNGSLGQESLLPVAVGMLVLLAFTVVFLVVASYILERKAMKGL
ncbi:MAG: ABC transporter permease [Candidatus Methanomethylophilaceae archaeon]